MVPAPATIVPNNKLAPPVVIDAQTLDMQTQLIDQQTERTVGIETEETRTGTVTGQGKVGRTTETIGTTNDTNKNTTGKNIVLQNSTNYQYN